MREVVPELRHVAIMANGDNASAVLEMREAQSAARHTDAIKSEIRRPDIAPTDVGLRAMRTHCTHQSAVAPRTGFASASWHWVAASDEVRRP